MSLWRNQNPIMSRWLWLLGCAAAVLMAACQPGLTEVSRTREVTKAPPSSATAPSMLATELPASTATPVPQPTVPLILERSQVEYLIPLHVQHKTQDQLVIMFELDQPVAGRVYWWPENGSNETANSIQFEGSQNLHLLTLQGLVPGQTYHLAVGLAGEDGVDRVPGFMGELWDPIEISTLSDPFFPLRIGVFGDSGFGESVTADLASRLVRQNLDFVIHTGDLVYSVYEQGSPEAAYREKWYQTLAGLLHDTAIYPVMGNHEQDGDALREGIPYYFLAFPMLEALEGGWVEAPPGAERQWYALEFGTLQMLFLNTQQLYGGAAREQQDVWLRSRLADDRFLATVVVFHVPPFTSGGHALDGAPVISSWVPEFEASNVVLVLSGHDHNYERLERNGITYVVSGGGSSLLYPLQQRREESLRFEAAMHYVLLEVGIESIQLTALASDGEIIDSDTIRFTPSLVVVP
jgi:hypothetical protein